MVVGAKLALLEDALQQQARKRTPRYDSVVDAVREGVDPVRVKVGDGYTYIPAERAEEIYNYYSTPRKPFVDSNPANWDTYIDQAAPSEISFKTRLYRESDPSIEDWSTKSPDEINSEYRQLLGKDTPRADWTSDVSQRDIRSFVRNLRDYVNTPGGKALYINKPEGGLENNRADFYRSMFGFENLPGTNAQILDTRRSLGQNPALSSILQHGDKRSLAHLYS